MHLLYKKIWCIVLAMLALFLCTACNSVPLSDRRIVKALFFEKTKAECMVTLLLQNQDENSDTTAFGRGSSFAEALYSAQSKLEGAVFYGTAEIAVFPYECTWAQIEAIGELLYEKVAPIPEISVYQLDKPMEQANKSIYDKQYEMMKEIERRFQFHWGLESIFTENNECVLPVLREKNYACVVIDKRRGESFTTQTELETQLLTVLNQHGSKIIAESAEFNSAVDADAHIEYGQSRNGTNMTLVLDDVQWTELQDDPHDKQLREKAFINEIKNIYADDKALFVSRGIDPFHTNFYSEMYGRNVLNTQKENISFNVVLNNAKP